MKIVSVLFLCVFIFGSVLAKDKKEGVRFENLTFEQALAKANANKKKPKMVFVDCYATWCGPCRMMSEQVFVLPQCGSYFNANFVSIKLDMEKEGADFAKKYNIRSYPTFVIFDATGQELNRLVGGEEADAFINMVKLKLQPENTLPYLREAYETNKSMKTGLSYLQALNDAGKSNEMKDLAKELYQTSTDQEKYQLPYFKILLSAVKYDDPMFTEILFNKRKASQILGTEVVDNILLDTQANTLYRVYSQDKVYTDEQVQAIEQLALAIALSGISPTNPTYHLGRLALFSARKDVDGLIQYFKDEFVDLPVSREKTMLEGVFKEILGKATSEQQARGESYFMKK